MLYKLRQVVKFSGTNRKNQNVIGITIPNEVALFFPNCYFSIEKSGTCILMKSGTNQILTKEEINDYEFNDCRI